jgi:type II secretory pathway pseudopilin PulG
MSLNSNRIATSRAAFTLVECVVAIMLLTLFLGTSMKLISTLVKIGAQSEDTAKATVLAEAKLDELVSAGYSNVTAGTDSVDPFTRAWTVDGSIGANSKLISVTVSWNILKGAQGSVLATSAVGQ